MGSSQHARALCSSFTPWYATDLIGSCLTWCQSPFVPFVKSYYMQTRLDERLGWTNASCFRHRAIGWWMWNGQELWFAALRFHRHRFVDPSNWASVSKGSSVYRGEFFWLLPFGSHAEVTLDHEISPCCSAGQLLSAHRERTPWLDKQQTQKLSLIGLGFSEFCPFAWQQGFVGGGRELLPLRTWDFLNYHTTASAHYVDSISFCVWYILLF
jgi:hypothetical protein